MSLLYARDEEIVELSRPVKICQMLANIAEQTGRATHPCDSNRRMELGIWSSSPAAQETLSKQIEGSYKHRYAIWSGRVGVRSGNRSFPPGLSQRLGSYPLVG